MQKTPVPSCVRKIPWRRDRLPSTVFMGFPGGSDGKESACNAGHFGLTPGSKGRSPGGGNCYPPQYSCLENPHGQRSLAGYSPCGRRVGHNWVTKHSSHRVLVTWEVYHVRGLWLSLQPPCNAFSLWVSHLLHSTALWFYNCRDDHSSWSCEFAAISRKNFPYGDFPLAI